MTEHNWLVTILSHFWHIWVARIRMKPTFKFSHFFLKIHLFDLFMVVLGLSVVSASRGYSLVAVCSLLVAVASLVAEHGL